MFQKFLSKYGLGTHLALLAAAPLALTPFLDAATLASVILWLSALAVIWIIVEPSIRTGEHLSQARRRVRREIVRDPFFWFLCIAVLFAAFRLINTGIELRYDPEQTVWLVGESPMGNGPAAVAGASYLPFAAAVALFVVAMGIRHGTGLMARTEFGLAGAFFTSLGGLTATGLACAQIKPFSDWMQSGFAESPFWASSFGVWLIVGMVCGIHLEARRRSVLLYFFVAIAGNASVLFFFAPPILAAAWMALTFLIMCFSLAYLSRAHSGGAVARAVALAIFGFAVPVLLLMMFMPEAVRTVKINNFDLMIAFPEAYRQSAEVFSRISRQMCLANPWFGVGNGAFGLHVPFLAEKADWMLIPPQPKFAHNGYWTILAERGFLGCLLPVVGLVMLFVTYFRRMIKSFVSLRHQTERDVFAFVVPPVAWCPIFIILLLLGEAAVSPLFLNDTLFTTVLSVMAVSAAAFPVVKNKPTEEGTSSETSLENK